MSHRFLKLANFSALIVAACLLSGSALGQTKPPGGGGGGGHTGGGGNTPPPTPGPTNTPLPRNVPTIPNPTQEINRPIFLSGRVVLDHGGALTQPIPIQRVCNGVVRREGYTDTKGNFSIMVGENTTFQDASESGGFNTRPNTGVTPRQLWNCEIRATLPGYTSTSIVLAGRDFNGNPDIGTVVLSKVGGVEGDSISVVSLKAPDKARKEFDKARKDFGDQKYENADKHLAKALELYPQYAVAWELRAQVQERRKDDTEARKSYQSAIAADEKFVPPYIRLALLESSTSNWPEVLKLTKRAIELDPVSYPDAYFLNGAAHYNLKEYAEAEKSAFKAVELDKNHRFARAELLLGSLLQLRGQHVAAAEHLRTFLKLEPNCPELSRIQTYLAKVDQQNASAQPAPAKP